MVPVSVNVSRIDFSRPDFLCRASMPLQEGGVSPELLHLEVTETAFMENARIASMLLSSCRQVGQQIELDDFGAGWSSINALTEFPLDIVKLDVSLVRQLQDEKKRQILESTIRLAHELGLSTTVEGVETEEQLSIVRALGADTIQGFYYGKPMPEEGFRQYLIREAALAGEGK